MFIKKTTKHKGIFLTIITCCFLTIQSPSQADQLLLERNSLVSALRQGGYILYFRHAHTDWTQNDQVKAVGDWWSCSPSEMRQLSDKGRSISKSIGIAIQKLAIPVGNIYSSEYCRTRETAQQFGLGLVIPSRKIMNLRAAEFIGGREAVIALARKALKVKPPQGTNTIWVAHGNILRAATGEYPGEAGCIIFHHGKDGTLKVVGRLNPEDWLALTIDNAAES